MRQLTSHLLLHPASPPYAAALALEAYARLAADGALELRFVLEGALDEVRVPSLALPVRTDGLWRHTCCEVFVGHPGGPDYLEFNLSPSGEWAAYAFSAYRTPAPMPALAAPAMEVTRTPSRLELLSRVEPVAWAMLGDPALLEVGLTAVVEGVDGQLRHHALHHPLERPDFHDARSFMLRLDRRAAR
ncbi:MAG: DOMON-like domain-containing protein [Proteobacteria bacterium]|nr:DOMON-like domain-containing protein [Pseudomonadota bacterium]